MHHQGQFSVLAINFTCPLAQALLDLSLHPCGLPCGDPCAFPFTAVGPKLDSIGPPEASFWGIYGCSPTYTFFKNLLTGHHYFCMAVSELTCSFYYLPCTGMRWFSINALFPSEVGDRFPPEQEHSPTFPVSLTTVLLGCDSCVFCVLWPPLESPFVLLYGPCKGQVSSFSTISHWIWQTVGQTPANAGQAFPFPTPAHSTGHLGVLL